jgi:hypothetical protein
MYRTARTTKIFLDVYRYTSLYHYRFVFLFLAGHGDFSALMVCEKQKRETLRVLRGKRKRVGYIQESGTGDEKFEAKATRSRSKKPCPSTPLVPSARRLIRRFGRRSYDFQIKNASEPT